jgi:PPOX class probable F420-dependent enzyme
MTQIDSQAQAFILANPAATMTTLRSDGTPHTVRIAVALIDGRLWSSGTRTRVRTRHLRRDPRSTLCVFDAQYRWLTLECRVTILDGPDAAEQNLRYFEQMQGIGDDGRFSWFGRTVEAAEFLQIMRDEQRIIYEFDVQRAYGMYGEMR